MWRLSGLFLAVLSLAGSALWWTNAWNALAETARDPHPPTLSIPEPSSAEPPLELRRQTPPAVETLAPPSGAAPDSGGWVLHDPVVVPGCNLSPVREQDVSGRVDGVFREVAVDLGSPVRKGQVLGRLEDTQVRLQVELSRLRAASALAEQLARAKYEEANSQVQTDNQIRSAVAGAVSDGLRREHLYQREEAVLELRKAAEDREAAELELKKARHELEQHAVRSDLDGEVVKLYKRPGEAIKALEPAFRVADTSRLRVEGLCPVHLAGFIRPGMPALVEPEQPSRPVTELHGHTAAVRDLAVSPDGHWLASAGEDHVVMLWSCALGTRQGVLEHPAEVHAVAWSGMGAGAGRSGAAYRLLTGCADSSARVWPISRAGKVVGRPVELAGRHEGPVLAVAFSADGRWCATGGEDKRVGLWDGADGRFLGYVHAEEEEAAHRGPVTALSFTPDGCLVSAGRDNMVKVWKPGRGGARLVGKQAGRSGDVTRLGVSADGRLLLFDHGEELRILDRDRGETVGALHGEGQGRFQNLALFSPSGKRVLTATANGRLQLWAAPAPLADAMFFRQGYRAGFYRNALGSLGVLTAGAAPSGQVLLPAWLAASAAPVTGGDGEQVECSPVPVLWGLRGHELRHLVTPDSSVATCGAFDPRETVAFTGGPDGVIRVWPVPPAGEEDEPWEARITYVGSQVESGTGLVRIRAEMDNPPTSPRQLRPGAHATLTLYPETQGERTSGKSER